ncbi:ammonia-forming cytochrome c nitrite reductase subunit c552 [Schaalia suimastitidis]|uniref:ammonia-forming cytochrome c nitrite reductase subunit c552 n=1 Tax=Schaalia suimastitidis TaxID=121163 RepID=UPI00040184CF|nr:ammonia-forming cytochrome c nitrite reductase subunit c552 [Schaalia suimastitidis]
MDTKQSTTRGLMTRPLFLALLVVIVAIVTFLVTALLMNIMQRQHEGSTTFTKVVELTESTYDPAVWGQNFPTQYESYKRTSEFVQSDHGGVLVDHSVEGDPRTQVPSSKLEEDPRLVDMWAGYPFAVDYRHARGHEYMAIDQLYTLRNTQFKQPGTCANCHVSAPELYDALGNGDRDAGFLKMGTVGLTDLLSGDNAHPVACIDCHDPQTMALRVTRPAFERGIAAVKALEGIENYDVNTDATQQEMRAYVCAQCHVEYYFQGEDKVLTFPWDEGLDIDDEYAYYENIGHVDWTHKTTGATMLKAQHPEFEIWSNGVHAANGVTCADCHMNYQREGAAKVTNHQITTPLANVNASCGTCHKTGDGVLEARVANIQDGFINSRDRAFDALVGLIRDIEKAQADGVSAEHITLAQSYQRKASFYIDYVYSENSYGFHAPDYTQRILNQGLDAARMGQLALKGVSAQELAASEVSVANASHAESADAQ